jgi:hypothetical protein
MFRNTFVILDLGKNYYYIYIFYIYIFFLEVWGATSNSAYYGHPELWILRYPAHRYHAVPSPRFKLTTLWLRVRHPNHSATTLRSTKTITLVEMLPAMSIRSNFTLIPGGWTRGGGGG